MSTEPSTVSSVISSSVSTTSPLKLKTSYISFKLDETNYIQWRRQVLYILRSHDIYSHVDPDVTSPSPFLSSSSAEKPLPNPKYAPWFQIDTSLLSGLQATLTQSVFADIPDFTYARELCTHHSTLPSFSELKSLLLNHEIRITQYNQTTPDLTPTTAFYGSTFSSTPSSSSNFSSPRFYNNSGRGNTSYRGGRGGNNGSFRGNRGGGCGNGGPGRATQFYSFGN
ncbi:uncharacterized protein LOC113312334 [Papaver somniferum]|uniref:uncharacterized protein LOC113312334 n=1 Tax=Papaver somniferum TaxID=3469 RepID=UPI000E6FBC2C|nr:uncharacterized protein LOC113312334 [Papaver somniferum]